jgi:hypothetical protein
MAQGRANYLVLPFNRSPDDGPVMAEVNGHTYRMLGGELHSIDGPTIEWADGVYGWYLNGTYYELDDWLIANTEISEEEKVMLKLQYG